MSSHGLYCEAGGFYIDPHRGVDVAIITHAHSDHARRGSATYHTHRITAALMRTRLGRNIVVHEYEYGEEFIINGVTISLHPAGHVAGSAQIRCEHHGEVWVVTGDYKRESDPIADDFELVPCNVFITESTFALPVYRWKSPEQVFDAINQWWRSNCANGGLSVITAYSLGKAQRLLAQLDATIADVYVSEPIHKMNKSLFDAGVELPAYKTGSAAPGSLLLTSASFENPNNVPVHYATASGWNAVRRHHRSGTFPFVLSDHVDWPSLLTTIRETGCSKVFAMHGFTNTLVRYLKENGIEALSLEEGSGRTAVFFAELTTRRAMNVRSDVCASANIPEWLFDASYAHTKNLTETEALILGRSFEPTRKQKPATTSTPEIELPSLTLNVVLYHVHRDAGGRMHKLTMGVWDKNTLVPLVHVSNTLDAETVAEIEEFARENTTVQVGPVRTLAPHFVFSLSAKGASKAPRRKAGFRLFGATIIKREPDMAAFDAITLTAVQTMIAESQE